MWIPFGKNSVLKNSNRHIRHTSWLRLTLLAYAALNLASLDWSGGGWVLPTTPLHRSPSEIPVAPPSAALRVPRFARLVVPLYGKSDGI